MEIKIVASATIRARSFGERRVRRDRMTILRHRGKSLLIDWYIRQAQSFRSLPKPDLAPDLKEFDGLLAEHKGEKTDQVADVLMLKSMIYSQVLKNDTEATAELQQLKADFPDTADGKKVDGMIASLQKQAAANKIQRSLSVGTPFPDFQVTDLDGKPLSVSQEKGKLVLIDFWATWCGPCVKELPNVAKVYQQYHDKGFDIIGISLDDEKDKLTSFLQQKQMSWPQYFDGKGWSNTLARTYGVNSIPATYLIGRDGKIVGKDLRGEALENAVKAALAANVTQ